MTDHVAEKQVREFIKILETDYNITITDAQNCIRHCKLISKYFVYFIQGLLTGVAIALLYAIWEGIKHFLPF